MVLRNDTDSVSFAHGLIPDLNEPRILSWLKLGCTDILETSHHHQPPSTQEHIERLFCIIMKPRLIQGRGGSCSRNWSALQTLVSCRWKLESRSGLRKYSSRPGYSICQGSNEVSQKPPVRRPTSIIHELIISPASIISEHNPPAFRRRCV